MPTTTPTAPSTQKAANPPLTWPPGTPTWMKQELTTLANHDQLTGISPQIMAAIAQIESGYEVAGAGVNSEGYGGYFGLGATKPYAAGTPSRSLLETNSPTSFKVQAKIAADLIYTYESHASATAAGGGTIDKTIIAAVNHYVNGGSYTDVNPGSSPDAGAVWRVLKGGAAKVTQVLGKQLNPGGTPGAANPTTLGLGGIFHALTSIATDIGYLHDLSFWKRVGIFLGGAALLGVGIFLLAQQSPGVRKVESTAVTAAAV